MQIPYRKPGKFSQMNNDPKMTRAKFAELESKLAHLKKIRPTAAAEVARLAELGDFSENAEYQLAKGRLRGINNNITKLEQELIRAEIISENMDNTIVRLGHTVSIDQQGKTKRYQILGSAEAKPSEGKISYNSPLGSALMGKSVGDEVEVQMGDRTIQYTVVAIEQ